MRRPALAAALVATLSLSAVARASGPDPKPAAEANDPGTWYGWQALIPDALSLGALSYGYVQRDSGPAFYGALTFLLVPPVIHLLHGHPEAAGKSVVYRLLGAPAAFLFVLKLSPLLVGVACPTDRACQNVMAGVAGLGLLGAVIADAGQAYDPHPAAPALRWSGTW